MLTAMSGPPCFDSEPHPPTHSATALESPLALHREWIAISGDDPKPSDDGSTPCITRGRCSIVRRHSRRGSDDNPPVVNRVRHDQRKREEDQTQDEVADEAVPLAAGDARGPERE